MKHRFATGQFILIYSIIVLIYKFFDCHEICTKPELRYYEEVIFESDAYRYSHHYHYSQTIRSNQSLPVIRGRFETLDLNKEIDAKFLFTFYGATVIKFQLRATGTIYMYDQKHLGEIRTHLESDFLAKCEILFNQELLTVRQYFSPEADSKIPAFNVTTMLHPNGKISIYYEKIPKVIDEGQKDSQIYGVIRCGEENKKTHIITVPGKWIQSGTLVEYEALGEVCPKHNTSKTCHGATTPNTTCVWCEKVNMCITSNDKDSHEFKVNGCKVKSSILKVSTEPTTEIDLRNKLKKTSSSTESHLIMTTDATEDIGERKSSQYLYFVVPLVITFLILCIGCGIWLWFYRRNRVYQWFSQIASRLFSSS